MTLIEKLRNEITSGRVVTVAGTGVSVATCGNARIDGEEVATWRGLLRHGLAYCQRIGAASTENARLLKLLLDSNEMDMLISAADLISQRLISKSPGVYGGWLKDALARLPVAHPGLIEALAAFPGTLATLNYDDLIERVTGRLPVTWKETERVGEVLRGELRQHVLHLHGAVASPDTVVLGLRSYLEVRDDAHTRAVLELMAISRTLLFVGCGNTFFDPNFARLMEWGAEALKDVAPRHFLLCRERDAAELQQRLKHAPWLQILPYGNEHSELEPFLRALLSNPTVLKVKSAPAPPSIDLRSYKQAMQRRYGQLNMEEVDPTSCEMRPMSLTQHYIPPSARQWRGSRNESVRPLTSHFAGLEPALEAQPGGHSLDRGLLARSPLRDTTTRLSTSIAKDPTFDRLVILGDPGSGKSTLLRFVMLEWVEAAELDDRLVLLIELREYARLRRAREVSSFVGYLRDGAGVRWQFDERALVTWLRNQSSVVLFDGLDEVFDTELRDEISVAIHRFADEYPRARIIVSSRKVGFNFHNWQAERFKIFTLQDLTDEQISEFLSRWHRSTHADDAIARSRYDRLRGAIHQVRSIRLLAGNPLLLTMMAILSRAQELPRDRADLYEQCARLLLHQWKTGSTSREDRDAQLESLSYKDKRGLLMRAAFLMQTQRGGLSDNLIEEDALERVLGQGLKALQMAQPDRAAHALIELLRGRNFILCAAGPRWYAFVHRTFLEYFCALEISDRFQAEQVLTIEQVKHEVFSRWEDPSWHEVLCLLCGMLAPRFVAELLGWLLEQQSERSTLVAARCLNEVRKRHEIAEIDAEIRRSLESMIELSCDQQLVYEAVGMLALVWRTSSDITRWLEARLKPEESAHVRAAALRELARGWPDAQQTFERLAEHARKDAHPIVRVTAIVELEQHGPSHPKSYALIKSLAESDTEYEVRVAAISVLASRWRDSSTTLGWLTARLESDQSSSVRQAIISVLAREWPADPSVSNIIKGYARSDGSPDIRQIAVAELARRFFEDPETLDILKERAVNDGQSFVRWAAIEELGRGWNNDFEVLRCLKDCGIADESPVVRSGALQAIARGWAEDREMLRWLKSRAQSDPDPSVRSTAHKLINAPTLG